MKTVEIVTHCYSPEWLPMYAEHLKWQFSSILRYGQRVNVILSVCYTPDDKLTSKVLRICASYQRKAKETTLGDLKINRIKLEPAQLFRRAIGRNIAALNTKADVVWFTDVDYMFGPHSLQTTLNLMDRKSSLCMPREIWINHDHETGDRMLLKQRHKDLPEIPKEDFHARNQKICIGGVQIIGADFCHKNGYLSGTKWVEPVDPDMGFKSCRCDKAFRSHYSLGAERLDIPNVFRIRHTMDGRDWDSSGRKRDGKEAW